MYKIYINELPMYIVSSHESGQWGPAGDSTLILPYLGKYKSLTSVLDLCDNPGKLQRIILYSHRPSSVLAAVKKLVKEVPAAGGLLLNELGEMLFIYRRGHWDLPKGKLDPGEDTETAAVREMAEETGIRDIELGGFVGKTYHIFRTARNSNRYLKTTSWYDMKAKKQTPKVQKEEDIEEALWITPQLFLSKCKPVYSNITDIVEIFIGRQH